MAYIHKVLVGLDTLGSIVTGGKTDETISGRLARARVNGSWTGRAGCAVLSFFTRTDHCAAALVGDLARAMAEAKRVPLYAQRSCQLPGCVICNKAK